MDRNMGGEEGGVGRRIAGRKKKKEKKRPVGLKGK